MALLIVEDNTISSRMLEVMLSSNGFDVLVAKTGRQALEKLAAHDDIQMVLTDIMMPEMDGWQLMDELRGDPKWRDIPLLVVSSLNDADTVRRVVQMGCRNYLVKPLKEDILIPKVRALLAESHAQAKDGVLRAKFDVLQQNGLDVDQYDRLFDAFFAQATGVAASLRSSAPSGTDDDLGRGVIALRDGAAILATPRLSSMIDGFRRSGSCDFAALRSLLQEVVAAMESAIEKRNRVKMKLERGEALST